MWGPEWRYRLVPWPSLKDKALWTSLKTLKQVRIKMVALFDRTCAVQYSRSNMSIRDEGVVVVCEAVAVSCLPNGENFTGESASLEVVWGLCRELWNVPHYSRLGIGLYQSESLQRAFKDSMTAPTSTDGCAVLEGGSAGHSPVTKVLKTLFLPCRPELAVVDCVPPGVHHSLVQHCRRGLDQPMGSC